MNVKTTQRTFRMVNDMAAPVNFVMTLARAVAAVAVLLLAGLAEPAGAAAATYYVEAAATVNVGFDGNTTMTTLADITVATPAVAATNRAMTNTTAPTGTTRWRIRESAATTSTNEEYFRAYTPTYSAATTIAAAATAYADFYMSATGGTSVAVVAVLYEYNDSTGIVGAAKGTASFTGSTSVTTRQTMNNVSFGNAAFTVAAGNRLMVAYGFTTVSTRPAFLWGQSASGTPSGYQSFTVNESPAVTGTVTMATGANPTGTTLAPGAAATQVNAFTLQVTSGTTDNVNAVTVNLAGTGNAVGLASLSIQNSATCTQATPYGTDTTVTDGANAITLTTAIPVTTTATTYYVCATPKTHAAMPAPPGATYAITANVSSFTPATYTAAGSDTAPATPFSIDNLSPNDVTGLSVTPGNGQLVVNWTNPSTDYARTMVLYRATTAISDVPVEGTTTYAAPGTLGASTIAYVGGTAGAAGTTTITGLTNGTLYNVKVFVQDAAGNWSTPGAATSGTPTAPPPPPGAPGTPTYSGVSTASITVNWTAGTAATTYNVDFSTDGTTFASAATGVATTTYTHAGRAANTQYWYRVTAVNVSGSAQGASSSTWTLTNPVAAAPTSGAITTSSIAVSWTAPTPAATTYLVEWSLTNFGAVVGSTTVTGTVATASGLTQGTAYYFRVTALNGAGVAAAPSPVGGPFTTTSGPSLVVGDGTNPGNASICPSPTAPTGPTMLDAFTLQATSTADVVSRITVQLAPAGAWINIATVEITNAAGTTVYGSAIPGGDQVNVYVTGVSQAVGVTTPYAVRITPKTHAAMPAPNVGQQYAITGTVTSIASNNPRSYGDTASATVTVDNLAPSEVAWTGVSTGANNIQLNWATATNVVVLRKQGGPVTDSPVDGTTYTAGATIGASTVACAGSMALCNSIGLSTGTGYYFEVFTADACTNYSLGAPVGPLYAGGLNEGSATPGTLTPVVAIVNPMNPATLTNVGTTGFRVQVRAFSRMSGGNAQPITAVRLKAATPAQTFVATCDATNYPIALSLNANYPSSVAAGTDNHGIYEATVSTAQLGASRGAFTLRACATNGAGTVVSGPVGITVNDGSAGSPRGDGNLLVRDNGAQLCNDCHAIATHASETVGNSYGSWYAACRDCHTPHSTTNVELIRKQITPPGYRGQQPPRTVVFSNRTTGYSATGGAANPPAAAFANADGTGVCQVCHTATSYYRNDGTLAGGHNPNQACTDCHSHSKGLKASCTDCHGDKTGTYAAIAGADANVAAAPPTAADKVTTATTDPRVGAHQAHVNGKAGAATYRASPLGCADCHPVPNVHNGTRDAAWSVLATNTLFAGNVMLASAPTPAAGTNAYTATWELTPTCTNACHGANIPSNATKPSPSWTAAGGLTCASCHGAPPPLSATPNQTHPQNAACATCHGAGYAVGATPTVAKTTHINGTLDQITSGCTACHGELGAPGVTLTVNTVQAAPGASGSGTNSFDTTGLATGNVIGAHKAHLVGAGGTPRWRSTAIPCAECHLLPPSDVDTTHATGVGTGGARATMTFGALAQDTAFETKTAAYAQPTCSSVYCHDPKSADTAAGQNNLPKWNDATTVAQCGSCHGLPPTTTSHPANTACGSCHPGYTVTAPTSASTIAAVNAIAHINGQLDGGESSGGSACLNCHKTDATTGAAYGKMVSDTTVYHHVVAEGAAFKTYPLTATGQACLQCHADHDVFNPALNTLNTLGRGGNLRTTIATAPTKVAPATGNYNNTDFSGTAGICISCHSGSLTKSTAQLSTAANFGASTMVVDGTAFGSSAHQYTVTGNITTGGTPILANCMKCHSDPPVGTTYPEKQSGTYKFALHTNTDKRLRNPMGITTGADDLEEKLCFRCHSNSTDALPAAYGPKKTVANKDYFTVATMSAASQNLYATFTDTTHGTAMHNVLGYTGKHQPIETGTYIAANRHVECEDCHNPHATKAGAKPATNNNLVWGPLTGVSGVTIATWPAAWTATTAASYTVTASSTTEWQICFTCHSLNNASIASWTGLSTLAMTDLALEFNPANKSRHPVVSALNATGTGTSTLTAAQLVNGWAPGNVMTCSDCHGADSVSPATQGPHGSAVRFFLKGTNKAWPFTVAGALTGTPLSITNSTGAFCLNCHPAVNAAGTSWFHLQVNQDSGHPAQFVCVKCHIRVPHGGKVSRLVNTALSPARYQVPGVAPLFTRFTKSPNNSGYSTSSFSEQACSQHKQNTTGEAW